MDRQLAVLWFFFFDQTVLWLWMMHAFSSIPSCLLLFFERGEKEKLGAVTVSGMRACVVDDGYILFFEKKKGARKKLLLYAWGTRR
jgi:hypothetical protein